MTGFGRRRSRPVGAAGGQRRLRQAVVADPKDCVGAVKPTYDVLPTTRGHRAGAEVRFAAAGDLPLAGGVIERNSTVPTTIVRTHETVKTSCVVCIHPAAERDLRIGSAGIGVDRDIDLVPAPAASGIKVVSLASETAGDDA